MSTFGEITIDWGDGTYKFRLGLGEVRQIEAKCNCGMLQLFNRIKDGAWRVDDLREVLRLSLIGAGMRDLKALALIRENFDEREKPQQTAVVMQIIAAWLIGVPDDPVGKTAAAGAMAGATESSPSPPSTASAAH